MLSLTNSDVFRAIVDRIDIRVYAVDLSGKIVYWNHGAEEITGFLGPQCWAEGAAKASCQRTMSAVLYSLRRSTKRRRELPGERRRNR